MDTKVLVTLGPASLNKETVKILSNKGVDLFRINLSHTKLIDLEGIIQKIQSWANVPICLDSEGAQIRNQDMINECVSYEKGGTVKIHHDQIIGDHEKISFTPQSVSRRLKIGDIIKVDFNSTSLRIFEDAGDYLLATVENGGVIGSNKAADLNREIHLDALTDKDKHALEIGLKLGLRDFSLSFTNTAEDVKEIRKIIGSNANLISKIESIKGVINIGEILPVVDQILIDRGDLSRQISIEKIPFVQRKLISYAKSKNVPVFVATNLLESMVKVRSPTRAEVNDVASTLLMGAQGLVLAAETAIGAYPVEAVEMVYLLIRQYNKWTPEASLKDIIEN